VRTLPSLSVNRTHLFQRLVTEATDATATPTNSAAPIKKGKRIFPRIIFYTTAATTTFYLGSAFLAFNNPSYHTFFEQNVPFAPYVLQYAEDRGWDVLTIADVVVYTYDGVSGAYSSIRKQLGSSVDEAPSKPKPAKATAETNADEAKGRVQKAVAALKTEVKASTEKVHDQGVKAAAIARHQGIQFSQGIEELVLEAEAALQGKPFTKSSSSASSSPEQTTHAAQEASESPPTAIPSEVESIEPAPKNVYHAPLPLGHEPPPGFSRPAPPKPPKPLPPGEPLPLVAPAVAELQSSDPILTHLAGTIDSLASFLNENPTAANKARDVLDVAKNDLSGLAQNFERLREEEKAKLEQSLDEQTREYTLKLLELELQAQDKLENQESDFRAFFEEEKARFAKAYREKLEQELRTQSDIINERCATLPSARGAVILTISP
jgi:mitofilin